MNKLKFPCLTRDFIHSSLYSSDVGYFMKETHQLGALSQPLQYHNLSGIYNYTQVLGNNYPKFAFLTPVEIFQPWYGHSLANYCLNHLTHSNLKIVEIGGGTGTCALSILDFLKKHSYKNYLSVDYTICEISPPLSAICKTRLKAEHGSLFDRNQLKVINKSIFDWNTPVNEQTFIIALEILDNFAHDRIWKNNEKWTLQTRVSKDLKEIKEDLKDELILKTLECYLKMPEMTQTEIEAENREGIIYKIISFFRDQSKADNMFLPTMCFKMFEVVHKYFKNPSFIISDFDSLPNGKIKGLFAPIVTKKGEKSHEKEDFESYLMEFGNVDIFFPVNFRLLQQISRVHGGNSGRVMKSYMFMEEFAKENWTQLKTGYRPLFDDFKNTKINMFGIIFEGQPVLYNFQQISETQWTHELPNGSSVNNLTFFLQSPLPEGLALALSASFYPFTSIEFIGAIANERPSDIIHTGWGFKQEVSSNSVKLLISMESISNIATLVYNKSNTDIRQVYAKKVALNLFRFMESFNKNTSQQELLVLPCDVLDKWLLRFEAKFRVDPYFVLNTE